MVIPDIYLTEFWHFEENKSLSPWREEPSGGLRACIRMQDLWQGSTQNLTLHILKSIFLHVKQCIENICFLLPPSLSLLLVLLTSSRHGAGNSSRFIIGLEPHV